MARPALRKESERVGFDVDDVAVVVRVGTGAFEEVAEFVGSDFTAPETGSAGPDAGFGVVVGIATEQNAGGAGDAVDHGRDDAPILERSGGKCVAEDRSFAGRRAVAGHVGDVERLGRLESTAPGLFEMNESAGSGVSGFAEYGLKLAATGKDVGHMIQGKVKRGDAWKKAANADLDVGVGGFEEA